jgi:peptidoglycan hydrolase CwlO-like protein
MGKPSIKSRKTSQIRKKKRTARIMKQKEEEIGDLQVQLQDFKKNIEVAGGSLVNEINKCSRENNNLVKWLKLYDEQLNSYQQEIYNLNIKLYFSSPQQLPSHSQPQHQLQQSPTFKSLADYFRSQE